MPREDTLTPLQTVYQQGVYADILGPEWPRQPPRYIPRVGGGGGVTTANVLSARAVPAAAIGIRTGPIEWRNAPGFEDEVLEELESGSRMDKELFRRNPIVGFPETIGTIFNRKYYSKRKEDTVVGIEVEQETKEPFELPVVDGWEVHREGSLRDFGFEYVLSPPRGKESALTKYLPELFKWLPTKKLSSSIRTSIHVHYDVTRYTFADLVTFACVYWLCEPILSEFAGESRKGNLFCLRAEESNYLQKVIADALKSGNPTYNTLFNENTRYASLNFASVKKFGSIETRLMRGTADKEEVEFWVNTVDEVRKYALKFSNPREFLDFFFSKETKAEDFYASVFTEETLGRLKKSCRRDDADLIKSVRNIASSLYCIRSARSSYDFTEEIKKVKDEYKEWLDKMNEAEKAKKLINRHLGQNVFTYPLEAGEDNVENLLANPDQQITITGDH